MVMYDIKTIEQLVDVLGGPVVLGGKFGITQEAVSNWSLRGNIPGGWHVQLYAMAARKSMTIDPAVFKLTESDVDGLFRLRSQQKKASRSLAQ